MNFQDRLYQKQAERITVLTEQVKSFEEANKKLREQNHQLRASAEFYNGLVRAIGDDIMLQDEWRRFIGILRLSNPDLPGITKAESEFS